MRNLLLVLVLIFCGNLFAQDLEGVWKLTHKNGHPVKSQETIKIFQDDYFAFGSKEIETNKFLAAGGGEYFTEDGYTEVFDFHTERPELIGTGKNYELQYTNERMILSSNGEEKEVWQKISDEQDDLAGNWVFTGRKKDGELRMSTPGARRTVKILGGGRFQWIAFNSDTKEFFGTGGGTYSAENGKYIENIEFFSRDNSRVGAKLEFDFEIKDDVWHHSGTSSKGDPIYEIWAPYSEAYQRKQ